MSLALHKVSFRGVSILDALTNALSSVPEALNHYTIIVVNSEAWQHPDLARLVHEHVSKFGPCSGIACDINGAMPDPATIASIGQPRTDRDLFAFPANWLRAHMDECRAIGIVSAIRKYHGITKDLTIAAHPAELPLGYLARQKYSGSVGNIILRRSNSLGDVLAATSVASALTRLGHRVTFQAHTNTHPILRRIGFLHGITEPDSPPTVDLDGAYETDPERTKKHFVAMFTDRANAQLANHGISLPAPFDYAPRLARDPGVRNQIMPMLEPHPKPWIMICPRSQSFKNRSLPLSTWEAVASKLPGTKFWLGFDKPPGNIVDLQCRHVDTLIEFIGASDLLIAPDTGPSHIAIAMGIPAVVIGQSSDPALHFSDQRDWIGVYPPLDCLNCQKDTCPLNAEHPPCIDVSPDQISDAANARLRSTLTEDVTAVICLYKPDVNRLNRCIAHVIDQVQEIVVVANMDTPWPLAGAVQSPKIRYLRRPAGGIGYSRNANYGCRHANGKYFLMLNDDVFLSPDVVATLRLEMRPDVGAVTHTLRYENGTIQYAGKYREHGGFGFGHVDHRRCTPRHTAPIEQESLCGASMLIRRKAYYDAGGYTEAVQLYSEDDWLSMSLRKAGWKIIFTPHCQGVHLEHQSTKHVGNLHHILEESSALFAKEWGWYFRKNPDPNLIGKFT